MQTGNFSPVHSGYIIHYIDIDIAIDIYIYYYYMKEHSEPFTTLVVI